MPVPGPEEVLVYVEAASICGTDVHIWGWDRWSQRRIKPPLTIGHEFCGTVVEVGDKVRQCHVGDYVSAESHVTCGMCYQWPHRSGTHVPAKQRSSASTTRGQFANYIVVPEKVIWQKRPYQVPPGDRHAAGAVRQRGLHDDEPGSVPVNPWRCSVADPSACLPLGIAKAVGAKSIFASDVNPYRANLAKDHGRPRGVQPGRVGRRNRPGHCQGETAATVSTSSLK